MNMNNTKTTKELSKAIGLAVANALREMTDKENGNPEIRKAWNKSFEDLGMKVLTGQMKKREAKKLAKERREKIMMGLAAMFLADDNEVADMWRHSLHNEMKEQVNG